MQDLSLELSTRQPSSNIGYYGLTSDRTQVLSVCASAFHWLSRTAFIPGLKARGFLPPFL